MKIDINKNDLWYLRQVLNYSIDYIESLPNPSTLSKILHVARKVNRKVTKAIKKSFGHNMDCTNHQKNYE